MHIRFLTPSMLSGTSASVDWGDQIEDPTHIEALVADKRAARRHRGTDRLARAAPASQTLLLGAAARGDNLGAIAAALLRPSENASL
ncbi:hypothetical protein [Bradyrhizobium sp.]|uniref:hypothetical protein n=1 Tax=Bradyrhizobium sp. TaxID=376 RepID=UPI003C1DB83F